MSLWSAQPGPPPSVAADPPGSRGRGRARRDPLGIPLAVVVVALGVVLVIWEGRFRVAEAKVSAFLLRTVHLRVPARALGTSVVFPLRGRWVGYTLSVSCTAALLLLPFVLIAAGLLASGRINRRRALASLGVVTAIIVAINQLRFMVIAGSMVAWGFRIGYERSHILLGTVLSTLGVVVGVIIFIWMLIDKPGVAAGTS